MSHIRDQWQARTYRALMLGVGSPEFIKQCEDEFKIGQELVNRVRDPDISRRNLEALRSGSLEFEVTYEA